LKKTERKKLAEKITAEIGEVKKLIAVLEESAKLLSNEGSGRRGLREMIRRKAMARENCPPQSKDQQARTRVKKDR
jgi:hypothetical protein